MKTFCKYVSWQYEASEALFQMNDMFVSALKPTTLLLALGLVKGSIPNNLAFDPSANVETAING